MITPLLLVLETTLRLVHLSVDIIDRIVTQDVQFSQDNGDYDGNEE
jgi:hypothetical protein